MAALSSPRSFSSGHLGPFSGHLGPSLLGGAHGASAASPTPRSVSAAAREALPRAEPLRRGRPSASICLLSPAPCPHPLAPLPPLPRGSAAERSGAAGERPAAAAAAPPPRRLPPAGALRRDRGRGGGGRERAAGRGRAPRGRWGRL